MALSTEAPGPSPPRTGPAHGRHRTGRRMRAVIIVLAVGVAASALAAVIPPVLTPPQTTVTLTMGSWAVQTEGNISYYIPICGWGGGPDCPSRVPPGSSYLTAFSISGEYQGRQLNLSVPVPFALASTDPALPVTVPASGIQVNVSIRLPTTPGEYSLLGTIIIA